MPYEITRGFLHDKRPQHLRRFENNNRITNQSENKMILEDLVLTFLFLDSKFFFCPIDYFMCAGL